MRSFKLGLFFLMFCLLHGIPALADVAIPDPYLSFATMAHQGPGPLILLTTPDGTGGDLSTARTGTGIPADATITLVLLDSAGFPIPNFPWQDIWIQKSTNPITFCNSNYWHPESNTDANGMTRWVLGPAVKGFHQGPIRVFINGQGLFSPRVDLSLVNPDINGDGVVNLGDVVLFAVDFHSGYQFRSDLHPDGVINLSDVIPLANGMGSRCN